MFGKKLTYFHIGGLFQMFQTVSFPQFMGYMKQLDDQGIVQWLFTTDDEEIYFGFHHDTDVSIEIYESEDFYYLSAFDSFETYLRQEKAKTPDESQV